MTAAGPATGAGTNPTRTARATVAMLAAAVVLVAVFVALAVAVSTRWPPLLALDATVEPAIHRVVVADAALLGIARVVTVLGSPVAMNLVTAVALIALLVTRRPRVATYIVAARLLELAVETAAKSLIDRPRPVWDDPVAFGTNTSFPSGHSAGTAVVVLALLLLGPLTVGRPTTTTARAAVTGGVVLGVFLLLAVPTSRVMLGVHYPTDVTAGLALGAASALALAPLLLTTRAGHLPPRREIPERRHRRRRLVNPLRRPDRQPDPDGGPHTHPVVPAPRVPLDTETLLQLHLQPGDEGTVQLYAHGELDTATASRLDALLDRALRSRPHTVELDLTGVTFCAVAGLNSLARARRQAHTLGVTLHVRPSRCVTRLAELSGQAHLHEPSRRSPPPPAGQNAPPRPARPSPTPPTPPDRRDGGPPEAEGPDAGTATE